MEHSRTMHKIFILLLALPIGVRAQITFERTYGGGDADLDMDLGTPGLTMDACALEFDCVPVGDSLLFNFSFGSEEYPEYVGSSFNDAFAIYITGPGFLVPTNVAAIPGGTLVSINNVNAGVNYTYFHDNQDPPGQYVAYDGFTTNLTAFAVVQPGETYHFKVVVADVADMVFDSGVFLEAFSFHSPLHANGITGSQHNAMRLFQQGDNLLLHVSAAAVQGQPVLILDATGSIVRQQRLSNAMTDRKSTRLNSSHGGISRMPSSA